MVLKWIWLGLVKNQTMNTPSLGKLNPIPMVLKTLARPHLALKAL